MNEDEKGLYSRAKEKLESEFFPIQGNNTFSIDDACKFLGIDKMRVTKEQPQGGTPFRKAVTLVFYNLSHVNKVPTLKQTGNRYRVIDRNVKAIDLRKPIDISTFDLVFPYGVDDGTDFDWNDNIVVTPGDVIVIAGKSNKGKSTMCKNFLANNVNKHNCIYFDSEYNPSRFQRQMNEIDWVKPDLWTAYDEGRFILAENQGNYEDIIQPEKINIIDWLRVEDEFWKVATIIKEIKQSLTTGLAIIAIQKGFGELGMGGVHSLFDAALYVTMDWDDKQNCNTLCVIKAKECKKQYLDAKKYTFTIGANGTKFFDIKMLGKL